ncbi:MAG: hypothetical protein ACYCPV_01055 [Thermoplasmata archaeon]
MPPNCPVCGHEVAAEEFHEHLLTRHKNSVTPEIEEMRARTAGQLNCPICHQKIGTAEEVSQHIQQRHRL